jgi:osmotically inducible protein OsmC
MVDKHAKVTWKGDLENGSGSIQDVGSGSIGPLNVSWPARTGDEAGMTSPEELIAAAHASCFSMALSHVLNQAGTPPDQLDVSVDITFVPGQGITTSAIEVTGVVPGVSQEAFVEAAEDAKDNCPVSSALKGNVELTVKAKLGG